MLSKFRRHPVQGSCELFGLVGGESAEAAEEPALKPRVSQAKNPQARTFDTQVSELKAKAEPSKDVVRRLRLRRL